MSGSQDTQCCSPGTAESCRSCGGPGQTVDRITLKALLTPDALRRGVPESPRFCATRECPVVYFDSRSQVAFTELDVVVPVYAKHPYDMSVPVCYCFQVTPGDIAAEDPMGSSRKMIAAEVKAGHCACEVRNPKGSCCLGDVLRAEQLASANSQIAVR